MNHRHRHETDGAGGRASRPVLNEDVSQRGRELAREKLRNDPALALKLARILAE